MIAGCIPIRVPRFTLLGIVLVVVLVRISTITSTPRRIITPATITAICCWWWWWWGTTQRRHLPVHASNLYQSGSGTGRAQVVQNSNKATYNGVPSSFPPHTYGNYPNGNYASGTSTSTVSRATYVNTPHPPSVTNYPQRPTKTQTVPVALSMPVPKVKRESPLDLSVKTVRTLADSTLGDDERHYRPPVGGRYELPAHPTHYLARAPKVDFSPNFTMQQEVPQVQPPRHHPQQQQQQPTRSNNYYNYPYATSSLPKVEFDFQQRKRSLEHATPSTIPEKIPKDNKVDTWRQKMDLQIEQRLSSYSKPRQDVNPDPGTPTPNGTHYQLQAQPQYPYYNNTNIPKQATSTKPPATKKVLNLLRTSLQNKGVKKPTPDQPTRSYLEQEVLQPSTDVMAPLQPKPGIVGRRNVSPFTAVSLERNSNTPPTYKFHIPKAIDSVIISDEGEKEHEASMGGDLDGLAAFLAARIRTKAELKQVTSNDVTAAGATSNNNGSNVSPPKLKKDVARMSPSPMVVPKKLFGRNEMKRSEVRSSSETSVFDFPDSDKEQDMPVLNIRKDRSKVVAPGANKVMNSESFVLDNIPGNDGERASSPFSLLFNQTCDSFVEQLMGGTGKKRGRRKKEDVNDNETPEKNIPLIQTEIKKEVIEDEVVPVVPPVVVIKQEPVEDDKIVKLVVDPKSDTDSDTPLVHIASKQKKKFSKKEKVAKEAAASSDSEVEKFSRSLPPQKDFYASLKSPIAICKPGKKPTFGDGSDFRPGWEDALYRYKKSIRIPMQLIQVTRPPSSQRLSTSLPDLDPCPISPAPKTESLDSDMDSNCSFSFSKHYDSDQGSMKSFSSKCSILDKLLVRVGAKKRKRRKDELLGPKIIPKSESELLPTPSLEIKDVIVKGTLLGFRKKTIENFKDTFINNSNKIVGVNEFNTVVLKARTRTETRVLKEKATIREVFGEDRPASAPPVTCVDELKPDEPSKGDKENQLKKEFNDVLIKAIESKKLEINVESIKKEKEDDNITVISNDSIEIGSGRKKNKLRRKLSSGFDYIRKKKKQIKKEEGAEDAVKVKRRGIPSKATPESVDDIQKEIKQWVLNKGVGETHLHRASRSGYTDITAYCLEKMMCNPSPKDNAGYTPLHEACSKGHLDIARLLLQYGAQVSESAHGGIRPLHEAAENGYVEIIRLLLSYGADPSLATYSGTTPLQLASDDTTIAVLQEHLNELQGKSHMPWTFSGPASIFDGDNEGFDPLCDVPESDPTSEAEDVEFEVSEHLLPNLYILPECETNERWMILPDLSNALKIKSKETLLRQLNIASPTKSDLVREMKMAEFLEKAHCCQFMHANEKLNTRLSKIFLVKYTDKVKRLLNVEEVKFAARR
ncbi:uncharacterized protein [Atheta coriaria]|uniref:uncharacterized protein n=1 Tax=Dalotia coriaria TaxID=877792 RepID=UPI0031F39AAB